MKLLCLIALVIFSSSVNAKTLRALSLSPAITEMVFALGLEKNLVGVSEFSDYPEAAKKLPRVGPYSKPDVEKIISLHPDIIFVPAEGPEDVALKLKKLKLNFKVIEIKTLKQVGESADIIADTLGEKQKGTQFSKTWNEQISKIFENAKINVAGPLTAALIVQSDPPMVAASDTFLNEILTRCGGLNIYNNLTGYPKISIESLLQKKPRVILLVEHFDNAQEKNHALKQWKEKLKVLGLNGTKLEFAPPDQTTRPGPRLTKGIEIICQIVANSS